MEELLLTGRSRKIIGEQSVQDGIVHAFLDPKGTAEDTLPVRPDLFHYTPTCLVLDGDEKLNPVQPRPLEPNTGREPSRRGCPPLPGGLRPHSVADTADTILALDRVNPYSSEESDLLVGETATAVARVFCIRLIEPDNRKAIHFPLVPCLLTALDPRTGVCRPVRVTGLR